MTYISVQKFNTTLFPCTFIARFLHGLLFIHYYLPLSHYQCNKACMSFTKFLLEKLINSILKFTLTSSVRIYGKSLLLIYLHHATSGWWYFYNRSSFKGQVLFYIIYMQHEAHDIMNRFSASHHISSKSSKAISHCHICVHAISRYDIGMLSARNWAPHLLPIPTLTCFQMLSSC